MEMENTGFVRVNKYLADHGVCSRREADRLIEEGLVLVDGKVPVAGQKVNDRSHISVKGKPIGSPARKVVLAFYKPVGVTCTEKDPHAKKIVKDIVDYPIRVTYAGRLDKDSEGLLLLTNDGDLIDRMMRGANLHEKEYVVKTDKEITDDFLLKMQSGVYLQELDVTTRPCKVSRVGKYTFRIVLTQGLNRQIRRMCQELKYQVKSLKRERVMNITLGDLKPGQFREVEEEALSRLYMDCGLRR